VTATVIFSIVSSSDWRQSEGVLATAFIEMQRNARSLASDAQY
jgi:hypothetical protein